METLVGVARALSAGTGVNPVVCVVAVLMTAGAAFVVMGHAAIYVLSGGARRRRPAVPMSFEEAKGKDPGLVVFGTEWHSSEEEKFHYQISGTTRSGKSREFILWLRSVCWQITPGSNRRLILFDPKNEMHRSLFEGVAVPVHFLLPSDLRSSRWDLARDFDSPAATSQLAEAIVPVVANESSPFFTTSFREVLDGVMSSLNLTEPHRWDLSDVVHILESSEYTRRVLERTAHTNSKLSYFRKEKTWDDIRSTAENRLNALRITAAMWSRAESVFSLREFVKGESIVVLGRDPRYSVLLDPLNELLLTQLFGHLLSQPDDPSGRRRTYFAIDELSTAAGVGRPIPGFKELCEQGASRGVVVAVAYQSYADLKSIYKEAAEAILGQLQHQIHLRASDVSTAEYAAQQFGKVRRWVPVPPSVTEGANGTSTTKSWQWLERYLVPPEKFQELVPPSREEGLWGYELGPYRRDPEPFHLPGAWIDENSPHAVEDVEGYEMRPDSHQYLTPLRFADRERLDLGLPEGGDAEIEAASAGVLPRPWSTEPSAAASLPRPAAAPSADEAVGKLRHLIGVLSDADRRE